MGAKTANVIWDYVKSFQGYGFNKGHATSYGILGDKIAYLKCATTRQSSSHHCWLSSLSRSNYIASARAEGYKLLPPDVNRSRRGFAADKIEGGIRAGIDKVFSIGPKGASEIIEGAPFSDYDDFLARTTRRAIKAPSLDKLRRIGAFTSLGILAERADRNRTEFEILGFCLEKPRRFRGCKPKHVGERTSNSGWKHLGLTHGIDMTEGRSSVSKMFWIPPISDYHLKASPWASTKTWLLTSVDDNGVPLHLMFGEEKANESKLLRFLAMKCRDSVVCLDGMIRLPFIQNGPTGFRVFGITGAYKDDPQIFHLPEGKEERFKKAISELDKLKRRNR